MIQTAAPSAAQMPLTSVSNMSIGERYFVVLSDCCVFAEYEGLLVAIVEDEWHSKIMVFDGGLRIDTTYPGWSATPTGKQGTLDPG